MSDKLKAQWEVTLKNILYYVEDSTEQDKMLGILKKYNDQLPDGKLKDTWEKIILSTKKSYYDKVDYLISDILSGKLDNEKRRILSAMLNEIKPIVEHAERTFWDKLCALFRWS